MSTPTKLAIRRTLAAGTRAIALLTTEEERAVRMVEEIGVDLGVEVHTWSAASGVDGAAPIGDLDELFARLRGSRDDALFVVLDGAPLLQPPAAARAVRELAQRSRGPALVFVGEKPGPLAGIPEVVVEILEPPTLAELESQLAWIGGVLEESGRKGARIVLERHGPAIARAALGVELRTLDRLVAEGILDHGLDGGALAGYVTRSKPAALDRTGLLEGVTPAPADELGGLDDFKRWLERRGRALEPAARRAAIPNPRGVLLVGVQGCGKSLAARVCASVLGLPLLRLEPGRLFGGTVGESEANLRRVTTTAERVAPLVLWVDEIDKGLAGFEGAASDAGTAARVVGGLLTWLQERERPVFVVATANRVDTLPPELLRRGRLDEVFFVDLPGPEERAAILRVHLETVPRRVLGEVPPLDNGVDSFLDLARDADGMSGAELEGALVEARLVAYAEGRPLAAADLRAALETTVPLSRSRAEVIDGLRQWASTRARRA
jgi:MoxR-like ATPase